MEPEQENIAPYDHVMYIASLVYRVMEKELLTDKEQEDLNAWIKENDRHAQAYSGLQDREMLVQEIRVLAAYDTRLATQRIFDQLGIQPARKPEALRVRMIRRWTAAAAVLVLLATGTWLFVTREGGSNPAHIFSRKNDVAPGGNKAVLTLADGSRIRLDSAQDGQLAQQGGTTVTRQNGQVEYNTLGAENGNNGGAGTKQITYNTITTPRGGQYRVVLPDGSKVLLNAASFLRYPTAFTGHGRQVELNGEAFFEITKNASQPFSVKTRDLDVKVLGTSFDVMAYNDEPGERATLIDGAVQVTVGTQIRTLTPGEQALIGADGSGIVVQNADTDKEIAWTTGFFKFDHTDIRTIMREISRWYDIQIAYETKMNDSDTYSGRISRNLPLSDLTTFLEGNGIHHFRIEGRTLTVLP